MGHKESAATEPLNHNEGRLGSGAGAQTCGVNSRENGKGGTAPSGCRRLLREALLQMGQKMALQPDKYTGSRGLFFKKLYLFGCPRCLLQHWVSLIFPESFFFFFFFQL